MSEQKDSYALHYDYFVGVRKLQSIIKPFLKSEDRTIDDLFCMKSDTGIELAYRFKEWTRANHKAIFDDVEKNEKPYLEEYGCSWIAAVQDMTNVI